MEHPHVKTIREIKDLDGRSILFIETDLAVSPNDEYFDVEAFRDLEAPAQSYLLSHPVYDEFRIRRTRA